MITRILGWIMAASPRMQKTLWRVWYQFLARRFRQDDWTFMNYGFCGEESDDMPALEPGDERDRYCIQLYHLVASGADLRGRAVLEVGSGRGGGSSYIARYLLPAAMTGVDISDGAVELSRKRHPSPNLQFKQGDSEALPFPDASFDAVVNVESSHCYPSMPKFLAEVKRVLKPGGHFLWADFRAVNELDALQTAFAESGMKKQSERPITPNVLRALDLDSDRKQAEIKKIAPRLISGHFQDFAGLRGSKIYESFRTGETQYLTAVFQKDG